MKNSNFKEINASAMNQIQGGTDYATLDTNGNRSDTWSDNDGDKMMSPGDTICY